MEARNVTLSPQGFEYRYDPKARRLSRRTRADQPWGIGMPTFNIHYMSAEELRFVAGVIDEAREGMK